MLDGARTLVALHDAIHCPIFIIVLYWRSSRLEDLDMNGMMFHSTWCNDRKLKLSLTNYKECTRAAQHKPLLSDFH